MAEESNSKAVAGDDTITLRVRDQSGEEVFFKVKKTTKMQKVSSARSHRNEKYRLNYRR
jgi:small ubiquitin-related modifier